MCLPVEHYVCFYLIFFLYNIEDVPRKNGFPRKNGVVKTVIGVPGKVVYLHCATASLPCSSQVAFVSVETNSDGYLVGKELVILLFWCICFVMFYHFLSHYFVGTQNLIASIPGPSLLTLVNGKNGL